jgi:hypothetical protein
VLVVDGTFCTIPIVKILRGGSFFSCQNLIAVKLLIARYVWKVHLDEHTRKVICYSARRGFLDIIGPSDIAYNVSIIKNSKDM